VVLVPFEGDIAVNGIHASTSGNQREATERMCGEAVKRGRSLWQYGEMIDHISLQCSDVARSAAFYDAVLTALGGTRVMDFGEVIGYGTPPMPDFWIGANETGEGFRESHVAFSAPNRAGVDAFYEAAKAAGAEVLHEPRLWPEYHPNYYGVFVRDPDGNNVEAVCHSPE
jgi:catechol 2,3-dioxygenase-like lactoylglutathione lyase family enzyme